MIVQRERNGRKRKQRVAVAGLAALLSSGALVQASPQETKTKEKEKQVLTTQNKFYCNIKALNPAQRERAPTWPRSFFRNWERGEPASTRRALRSKRQSLRRFGLAKSQLKGSNINTRAGNISAMRPSLGGSIYSSWNARTTFYRPHARVFPTTSGSI
jgi:hypothetical protein